MASTAIYSTTQLKVKIGGSYVVVGGITDIGGPNLSRNIVEVTDMNSTAVEYKNAALVDAGKLTLGLLYSPGNTTHSYIVNQVGSSSANPDLFLLKFSDSTVYEFSGSFNEFSIQATDPKAGMLTANVGVQLTGNVIFSGSWR